MDADQGMVERVARAISGAPFSSAKSRAKARVAITAMREPTKAMRDAGRDGVYMIGVTSGDRFDAVWIKAIDAALAEPGREG